MLLKPESGFLVKYSKDDCRSRLQEKPARSWSLTVWASSMTDWTQSFSAQTFFSRRDERSQTYHACTRLERKGILVNRHHEAYDPHYVSSRSGDCS